MVAEIEKLSDNMENYLKVIYTLSKDKGVARVSEIAEKMDVTSPSVNAAIKSLADRDLVVHEKYGYVILTQEGKKIAEGVLGKRDVLYKFLTEFLMVTPGQADHEACSIEHAISEDTFDRFVRFFKFLETSDTGEKPKLLRNFETYLKTGKRLACDCERPPK